MATDTDDDTTKVDGQEMSWDDIVKKYGIDKARTIAPELDPKYQQMVKDEGQAQGSADYTKQFIDPQTEHDQGIGGLPSDFQQGLEALKQHGGVGADILGGLANVASLGPLREAVGAVMSPSKDPTKKGGGGTKGGTTGGTTTSPTTPWDTMFNDLANQYTSAMATVNPYIGGQQGAQATNTAQAIGSQIAGGAVEGANAAQTQMLQGDAAKYEAANNAGAADISNAIKATGPAISEYMQVSPYLGLLSALQSEAQYQTETQASTGEAPAAFKNQQLLPAITQMYTNLAQSGAGAGTTVPGATGSSTTTSSPSSDNPDTPDASG